MNAEAELQTLNQNEVAIFMKKLNTHELRRLFLQFFSERGHAVIPSASLMTELDAA